jgi:hypothetical protein
MIHTPSIQKTNGVIVPPLTANISFGIIQESKVGIFQGVILDQVLPESWNWKQAHKTDSSEILKKKRMISDSGNQELCGSCWAKSSSTIVSDVFVVSGHVDKNPELSATYILSCYPQAKCKGGNPALAMKTIAKYGISDRECTDYKWCDSNSMCNGKATQHFTEETDLSSLIPSCGCYTKGPHNMYHINEPELASIPLESDENSDIITERVKQHIYKYGPVLGGFLVFDNFINGHFTKIDKGIYFEKGIYDLDSKTVTFSDSLPNYKGAHAVAILGWGIEKNVKTSKDIVEDVPYWFCRNSWTNNWGDNGCFKLAMYPHNRISQFLKLILYPTPDGQEQLGGGIVMIKPAGPPVKQNFKINNYKNSINNIIENYNNLDIIKNISTIPLYIKITVLIILVIIVIFFVKKQKK